MSGTTCTGCGEEILPWQYSELINICKECYVILDMDRFKEIEPEEEENEA